MPRFLHTADWQIGRQYAQFDPDGSSALSEARIDAVERLGRLATEHRADAILVAGDVFDAQALADRTVRRLFNALASFAGPWVAIPGNHDAALAEGVWRRAARLIGLPPNLHVALEPGPLPFPALGFTVLTAPLTQRQTALDVTAWFDAAPADPGHLRIGLAHGSVQGRLPEEAESPNPIAPDRAARARLDYLALGDWHGCYPVDERTWYSGTPEPDRFKDNDSGQVLLVEVVPGAVPTVTRLPVARFRWRQWGRTVSVASDVDAIVAELAAAGATDVLDVTFTGRVDVTGLGRLRRAVQEADARVRALRHDLDGLRLAPTDEELAGLKADGYVGEVLAELRARQDTDATAALALQILAGELLDAAQAAAEAA